LFKKIIFILPVLVAVFILNGCDSGTYSAEKRFWHASKAYNELMKAPEKATQVDYQKVIDSFREITIRYPMWPNSAQAQFNIGQLYGMEGNLSKAKDEFGAILKDYSANVDMCARGLFMIALICEREDNWPKAKETLDKITDSYPNTGTAFQVPIHIAEYYKIKGQNTEAEAAYAAALDKYKKAVKDNPKTYGAIMTVDLIITCYVDQEKWNEALDYLSNLVSDYSDTLLAPKALFVKGVIYEQKLDQPDKARELYQEIMQKYSKTPFAKAAQKQIEGLNKPKK
jgi:TolA-binding protein